MQEILALVSGHTLGDFENVVSVLIEKRLCDLSKLLGLLLAAIAGGIRGTEQFFRRSGSAWQSLQLSFDLVDFCRSLLVLNHDCRDYFADQLSESIDFLPLLAVMNNSVNFAHPGSIVSGFTFGYQVVDGVVDDSGGVLVDSRPEPFDLRNLQKFQVRNRVNFDPEIFGNLQNFKDFFQKTEDRSPLEKLFFLASLADFAKLEAFRSDFSFDSSGLEFEPEDGRSTVQDFLCFQATFREPHPPFQLASATHKSSLRKDWSMCVSEKEIVQSSPLPPTGDVTIEFEFSATVSVTLVSVLNHSAICAEYSPFSVSHGEQFFVHIETGTVFMRTSTSEKQFLLTPGVLFCYLRIQPKSNVLIKFRVSSGDFAKSPEEHPVRFFAAGNPSFPMGSLFTEYFGDLLVRAAQSTFVKEISFQFFSSLSLDLRVSVSLVHSLLCDSISLDRIIRIPLFHQEDRPPIDLRLLLCAVNQEEFANAFLGRFEELVADPVRHGIWPDNRFAFRLSGPHPYSNCVVFGERISVIGEKAEVIDLAGFALPITHLNRSGIELLRFARNAVEVCLALNQRDKLGRIVEIGQKQTSPVFTSPDLYSIADFIPGD
jgi:hypothetical protein